MKFANLMLENIKTKIRGVMRSLAKAIDSLFSGKLSPNAVTIIGLLAHVPIAYLIAAQHYVLSGILLAIFGLFDTLDGELARLQHKDNPIGMFLDSSTDRIKEIMIYVGMAYAIVAVGRPYMAVWAVAALGISMLITYINAWGEVTMARFDRNTEVNKTFRGGLMGFEVRMFVIILGLLSGRIILAVIVISILGTATAIQRYLQVIKKLA